MVLEKLMELFCGHHKKPEEVRITGEPIEGKKDEYQIHFNGEYIGKNAVCFSEEACQVIDETRKRLYSTDN